MSARDMKLPERSDRDGQISIEQPLIGDELTLCVTHDGVDQRMELTRFNAFRLAQSLLLIIGIRTAADLKLFWSGKWGNP